MDKWCDYVYYSMSFTFCALYKLIFLSFCFQLETIVVDMQDPKSGVKGSEQKLNVTTIPHVIAGEIETRIHTHSQSLRNFIRL